MHGIQLLANTVLALWLSCIGVTAFLLLGLSLWDNPRNAQRWETWALGGLGGLAAIAALSIWRLVL